MISRKMKSFHFQKAGRIGTVFQTFPDALNVIEMSDIKEEAKHVEKGKVLEARKVAFGTSYKFVPPWSTN